MTLAATISLRVQALQSSALDLSTVVDTLNQAFEQTFDDGAGANQANALWSDTRTLSSNTSETLDLYGALTNAFGATLNFTKVRAIIIRSRSANTTVLSVGAASAPLVGPLADATDLLTIRPGGIFMITAPDSTGIAVTNSSADGLKIANASGAAATYDIVIIGTV